MARSEDVERRLLNWARWRIGGASGGLGYAKASLGESPGASRYRESIIPTNGAEAAETEAVVRCLEADLQRVVDLHYFEGLSVAMIAVRLSCSAATVYGRLDRVHLLLDQAFRDMQDARRNERQRVDRIQRQAAPGGGGFRD